MTHSAEMALLQTWFYATPLLLPSSFLALSGYWGGWLEGLAACDFQRFCLAAVLVLVLSIVPWSFSNTLPVAFVCIAACAAVIAAIAAPRHLASSSALALLVLANAGQRQQFRMEASLPVLKDIIRLHKAHAFDGCQHDVFCSINEAMRIIDTVERPGELYYWFDIDDPMSTLFDDLACTSAASRVASFNFPISRGSPFSAIDGFKPGRKLAVLSSLPDGGDQTLASLRA